MTDKHKKKLEKIRRLAREGRVVAAPQDEIDLLKNWVEQVLVAISEVVGNPGIANAWVSNLSRVNDFFRCPNFPNPPCDDVCTCSFDEQAQAISEALGGVRVEDGDYIVTVARRLAGMED